MIVDSMTLQEVGEAILKAAVNNRTSILSLIHRKTKDYRRIIIKGLKDRYDFQPLSFTADDIDFFICPFSLGKKDFKKFGMLYCLFAHIYYKGTNWYCNIVENYTRVNMYCNHFFERYIERHLKDDSTVNVNSVRRYFKEADHLHYWFPIENPRHPNCIYSATKNGLCCGFKVSDNIIALMTYLNNDTLVLGKKRFAYDIAQRAFETVYMDANGEQHFGIDE